MPPRAKVTREMILDAAFELVRSDGIEAVNARTVSKALHCSTQPVMYHFKTIEELKRAVYEKADAYHSAYLLNLRSSSPLQEIGLHYIRFAAEEKNLFRFLFQSNGFSGKNMAELIDAEELQPVIALIRQEAGMDAGQAQTVFRSVFLLAHGYASMLANNEMAYDEQTAISDLTLLFDGTVHALKGGA